MTKEEKKELVQILEALATISKFDLTPFLAKFYIRSLEPFDFDRVQFALLRILEEQRTWPTVSDIKAAMGVFSTSPQESIEGRAQEIASFIWGAIGRYGAWNPKEARASLGEDAWRIVEMQGGWDRVCDSLTSQKTSLIAQWRNLAMYELKKRADGMHPALSSADRPSLTLVEGDE